MTTRVKRSIKDIDATGNAILSEVALLKRMGYEHFHDITRKVEKFLTTCSNLMHMDLPPIFNLPVIPSKVKQFLNCIADCLEGADAALRAFLERLKYPGLLCTMPLQQARNPLEEGMWEQRAEQRAIPFPTSWEADEQDMLITLSWWRRQLKQEICALREAFHNYTMAPVCDTPWDHLASAG
ncbi:hypothetical protein BGX38DRAFT_1143565 [Terfezia claveryi]|nr:hypothetical protein BGX38DRAFT_1143565 [Terfezia claveryi]